MRRRHALDRRPSTRSAVRAAARRGRRRRSRGGAGSRGAASCTSAGAPLDERGVGAAVVAEQRDRELDVADHRRAPERRGALARDLGDHRDRRRRACSCGPSRSRSFAALGERVRVADVRARAARAARRPAVAPPRSPGRSARQWRAGGSATPGGRFCCWRGRSSGSGGNERDRSARPRSNVRRDVRARAQPCSEQAELDRVEQGLPRGLDDVLVHADRGPGRVAVGGVDQHPRDRAGALVRVEDAHLVVGEVHALERGEVAVERGPQRAVERVHRTVALGGRDHALGRRRAP